MWMLDGGMMCLGRGRGSFEMVLRTNARWDNEED